MSPAKYSQVRSERRVFPSSELSGRRGNVNYLSAQTCCHKDRLSVPSSSELDGARVVDKRETHTSYSLDRWWTSLAPVSASALLLYKAHPPSGSLSLLKQVAKNCRFLRRRRRGATTVEDPTTRAKIGDTMPLF
jgi:hypothetical protein